MHCSPFNKAECLFLKKLNGKVINHVWSKAMVKEDLKLEAKKLVLKTIFKECVRNFPGGTVVTNPPANAGDTGSSPGHGRSHMPRSN